jgi:hypothetical protein
MRKRWKAPHSTFKKAPVSWDNRRVRKDTFAFWFLVLFWIVWTPLTCVATVIIFTSGSPLAFTIGSIWCVLGWAVTLMIAASLVRRLCSEWIELDADKISWGASGPLAGKKKSLPWSQIAELSLGLHSDCSDVESMVTLNLWEVPRGYGIIAPRHLLAYWLSEEHKKALFERISEFVSKQAIPLKVVTYGT